MSILYTFANDSKGKDGELLYGWAVHHPFKIDPTAKEAWMMCMRIALAEHVPNKAVRQQIEDVFNRMATHMQNTQSPHSS